MSELKTKKTTNLQQRILSGSILGIAVMFCIVVGGFAYLALVFAVFIASVYESVSIVTHSKYLKSINSEREAEKIILKQIFIAVAAAFVPSISLLYIRFADSAKGFYLTIWLFVAIWSFDIFAYFAGRAIGGPKLSPNISPKKTWSGFIFGILCSLIASLVVHNVFMFSMNVIIFTFLSIAIAILSQMGDLIESKFKRYHGVKDSGQIIPGHGGVLDRMDGFLLTAPLLMLCHVLWGLASSVINWVCNLFDLTCGYVFLSNFI